MGAVQLKDVITTSGAALETTSQTIKTNIDTVDGNVDDIETAQASQALQATLLSTLAEVEIVEHHFHSNHHSFGLAASPSGETHRADLTNQVAPFVLTTGNNGFGAWVQLIGSSDTPIESGKGFFDLTEINITNTNDNAAYTIQFAAGESADLAAKVTAKDYTGRLFQRDTTQVTGGDRPLGMKRYASGTKIWARAAAVGVNAKTIAFYLNGIHEYASVV